MRAKNDWGLGGKEFLPARHGLVILFPPKAGFCRQIQKSIRRGGFPGRRRFFVLMLCIRAPPSILCALAPPSRARAKGTPY